MLRTSTCKVCQVEFSYEYEGGRLRRYCDEHVLTQKSGPYVCERCGNQFVNKGHLAKYCVECRPIVMQDYKRKQAEVWKRAYREGRTVIPEYKQCSKCKETKPADCFNKDITRKDGLQAYCIECGKTKTNEWWKAHSDIRLERAKIDREHNDAVRASRPSKHCPICGQAFPWSQHKFCSDECEKESNRRKAFAYSSAKKELKPRKCKECGATFSPEYGNKRRLFCSKQCLRRFNDKRRGKHGITGHDTNHRARRIIRAMYGQVLPIMYEPIDSRKVYERDNWICCLCNKPIDQNVKWPDMRCASVDHRVPLSRGGSHTYDNVQAAHMICNTRKSNIDI